MLTQITNTNTMEESQRKPRKTSISTETTTGPMSHFTNTIWRQTTSTQTLMDTTQKKEVRKHTMTDMDITFTTVAMAIMSIQSIPTKLEEA